MTKLFFKNFWGDVTMLSKLEEKILGVGVIFPFTTISDRNKTDCNGK